MAKNTNNIQFDDYDLGIIFDALEAHMRDILRKELAHNVRPDATLQKFNEIVGELSQEARTFCYTKYNQLRLAKLSKQEDYRP